MALIINAYLTKCIIVYWSPKPNEKSLNHSPDHIDQFSLLLYDLRLNTCLKISSPSNLNMILRLCFCFMYNRNFHDFSLYKHNIPLIIKKKIM